MSWIAESFHRILYMRLTIVIPLVLKVGIVFAQEAQHILSDSIKDKPKTSLVTHGRILLANIGFAPVPSFSFDDPIVIGFLSVSKKKLSYEPGVSAGLNGKPWIIDNWLKYKFLETTGFNLSAGINGGLFFKNKSFSNGEEVMEAHRNLTTGLFGDVRISSKSSLKFSYWYNKRCDTGTLSGHFLDVSILISQLPLFKTFFLSVKPEVFAFDNEGKVDGMFASLTSSVQYKELPLSIYGQLVQPLWTNFEDGEFKWSIGLVFLY